MSLKYTLCILLLIDLSTTHMHAITNDNFSLRIKVSID